MLTWGGISFTMIERNGGTMNCIVVEGNTCSAPENRVTSKGSNMATFTIADNVFNGETNFFKCVAFDKSAEFAINHVKSGSRVVVTGKMTTRTYEHNGQKRKDQSITVDRIEFSSVGKKKEDGAYSDNYKPEVNTNNNGGAYDDEETPF